jgi:predicted MFS family arabinose efflux permease
MLEASAGPGVQADATDKARWSTYQFYVVALLLLVNLTSGLDRHVLGILQEPLKTDLKLTDSQLGFINGPAFSIFYSFSAIPIARMAERLNRTRLLGVMLSFWSAATAACGLSGGFLSLALCRVGVGMGEGGCHPICQSSVADNFTLRQRGSAMAIYACGPPIASILAPIVGGVIANTWGWRVAFMVVGLPGILLSLLIWRTMREPRLLKPPAAPSRNQFLTDIRWAIGNRAFVFIFIAGAFNGLGITGISAFTSSFLLRTQGYDLAQIGAVVGAFGVIGLAGTLLGGWLADRFSGPRGRSYAYVPAVGAVLSLGFYLLAFTQTSWPLVLVGLGGANLAVNLKNGPNFAVIQNISPARMRATAAAIFTVASNVIGAGLGAWIVGGLSDRASEQLFQNPAGDFASVCPALRAAHALGPVATACHQASGDGLRSALAIVSLVFIGAAIFFYLAGRSITEEAA